MQDHCNKRAANGRLKISSLNIVPTEPTLGNTTIDCKFTGRIDDDIYALCFLHLILQANIKQDCRPILDEINIMYRSVTVLC